MIGIGREEQELFLEGVKIADVMSEPPVSISPEAPVQSAAALMADRKIGCLPVVEGDNIWLPDGVKTLREGLGPTSAADVFLAH